MASFFDKFKLHNEKEDYQDVITFIDNGVPFRGTNLWVLIFAIFIASLGLNVNSPAVIIGAMLISPLMGPIMGIGLGVGINDVALLRKSIVNYLIAIAVALTTSSLFFLISPLNDAHSEIIARTSPTIYDVLIALFGGFAGIIAISSKQKGNTIPGVAIATALMPPLCTAGYGLATLQFQFFFGAFYLFIINSVFIAFATFLIIRLLHFPHKLIQDKKTEVLTRRIVWLVVLSTLLPSFYFGYDLVQQNRFLKNATLFITNEAHFANDYLLNKKIDAKKKSISLVFGGAEIPAEEIKQLKHELIKYNLESASLEIKQGFTYINNDEGQNEQIKELNSLLQSKDQQLASFLKYSDSITGLTSLTARIYQELKVQYPKLTNAIIQPSVIFSDSLHTTQTYLVLLSLKEKLSLPEKRKLENWLKIRLQQNSLTLILQ